MYCAKVWPAGAEQRGIWRALLHAESPRWRLQALAGTHFTQATRGRTPPLREGSDARAGAAGRSWIQSHDVALPLVYTNYMLSSAQGERGSCRSGTAAAAWVGISAINISPSRPSPFIKPHPIRWGQQCCVDSAHTPLRTSQLDRETRGKRRGLEKAGRAGRRPSGGPLGWADRPGILLGANRRRRFARGAGVLTWPDRSVPGVGVVADCSCAGRPVRSCLRLSAPNTACNPPRLLWSCFYLFRPQFPPLPLLLLSSGVPSPSRENPSSDRGRRQRSPLTQALGPPAPCRSIAAN